MSGLDDLDREILEAVRSDYEPFEYVVSRVAERCVDQVGQSAAVIFDRVIQSLAHQFIEAYLIHAEPPYATVHSHAPDVVQNCWLLITPQGERQLQCLKEPKQQIC